MPHPDWCFMTKLKKCRVIELGRRSMVESLPTMGRAFRPPALQTKASIWTKYLEGSTGTPPPTSCVHSPSIASGCQSGSLSGVSCVARERTGSLQIFCFLLEEIKYISNVFACNVVILLFTLYFPGLSIFCSGFYNLKYFIFSLIAS